MSNGDGSIPGKITIADAVELARLAKGKTVLQIGAYCGRATVALAKTAKRVYLMDDWQGQALAAEQCAKNLREAELDYAHADGLGHVVLLFSNALDLALAPNTAANLPPIDLAYIDADRDEELRSADLDFIAKVVLGGRSAMHNLDTGKLEIGIAGSWNPAPNGEQNGRYAHATAEAQAQAARQG